MCAGEELCLQGGIKNVRARTGGGLQPPEGPKASMPLPSLILPLTAPLILFKSCKQPVFHRLWGPRCHSSQEVRANGSSAGRQRPPSWPGKYPGERAGCSGAPSQHSTAQSQLWGWCRPGWQRPVKAGSQCLVPLGAVQHPAGTTQTKLCSFAAGRSQPCRRQRQAEL